MAVCDPRLVDRTLYRRRQRRRAAIGWTALIAVVVLVAVGIALGGDGGDGSGHQTADLGVLPVSAEMTANDYESIREGEEEATIVGRLGSGFGEDQVEAELLALFPAQPENSHCTFWTLSDAPEHLVRLCFDDDRGVLLQKSVAAKGEDPAPKTLT